MNMLFTVTRDQESCGIEIDDKHLGKEVTLPTGHTIPLDMIGVVHLKPTGRVGVPLTMPDPVRKGK